MNFLGHLYFSRNDRDLMIANLFGDFVRGRNFDHFPPLIQEGIFLHRQIDHYIDTHPLVRELKLELMTELPKVGPIAVDLFFDHLLAKNWEQYHFAPYDSFLLDFYQHESEYAEQYPTSFLHFMEKLRQHKWMNHYPSKYGLMKSCEGVSKRLSFETKLADAHVVFEQKEETIETVFHAFMKDAILHFNATN